DRVARGHTDDHIGCAEVTCCAWCLPASWGPVGSHAAAANDRCQNIKMSRAKRCVDIDSPRCRFWFRGVAMRHPRLPEDAASKQRPAMGGCHEDATPKGLAVGCPADHSS